LVASAKLGDDFLLNIAKARLALALKKLADRAAQALLDSMVRVGKGQLQAPGQLTANGRFSGSWQAYEGNHHEIKSMKSGRLSRAMKKGGRYRPPGGF
jgi:hypothetical protein